jgi:TonB-dependent starch-binding outer membrane protein SusC
VQGNIRGKKLPQRLAEVLGKLNLSYRQLDNTHYVITAKAKEEASQTDTGTTGLLQPSTLLSLEKLLPGNISSRLAIAISGKVTDEKGEALPGVNVILKGTTTGTTTNPEGRYTLSVPDASAGGTLIFSYIGYTTEEVPINGRTEINISLVQDIKSLSEVVVVGYGTQKKSDLTGSITSISGEQLKEIPLTSLDQGLSGRAAGVQVTQQTGQPILSIPPMSRFT